MDPTNWYPRKIDIVGNRLLVYGLEGHSVPKFFVMEVSPSITVISPLCDLSVYGAMISI